MDRFGNALTSITAGAIAVAFPGVREEDVEVRVGTLRLRGVARSYGDAPVGTAIAIVGSSGRLEIAQVGGHAASRLGLGEGDTVVVSSRGPA